MDTSALVKLYVVEREGGELVRKAVEEAEMIATSAVAYAEARAGLARRQRDRIFTDEELRSAVSDLDEDWPTYARVDVSDSVTYHAGKLAERHALRGFDSIHLESALRLSERFEGLRFLAFDKRLNSAAREANLPVYEGGANAGQKVDGWPANVSTRRKPPRSEGPQWTP